MLFTDGIILTMQDLRDHDNYVLEVASTESIELSSKLALSQRAVGYELASYLTNREAPISLDRVVVTDELRDLLAVQTLAAVYGDAYNRNLNDRYLGRAKDFRHMSERSFRRFLQNGVGIARTAVRRADKPAVECTFEGGLNVGVYRVQIAWQHVAGNVGERSDAVAVECTGGGLAVTPRSYPENMAGWHVFISAADGIPLRQNEAPIQEATWIQANPLRSELDGPEASGPDYYVRQSAQMLRR
ncbi:MAG TPA: hypothetical protein VER03_06165 [Bryobacteraceae bacterium]|nr:hypothetical protein [Bryobacteraceae bacterium]